MTWYGFLTAVQRLAGLRVAARSQARQCKGDFTLMTAMSEEERIQRLEQVLGTLINWLHSPDVLSTDSCTKLLVMLNGPADIPAILRRKP
jgi:hypothetical protein